jgi:Curlin associated repeat
MRLTLAAAAVSLAFGLPTFAHASGSATINQSGVDNYGSIEQENTGGVGAQIQQIGDRNKAGAPASGATEATNGILQLNQTSSFASVFQRGNDNVGSIVQQNGTGNTAHVNTGQGSASNGNTASVRQINASSTFGHVFQDISTGSTGNLQQTGNGNQATLVQGAHRVDVNTGFFTFVNVPSVNNDVSVTQTGNLMHATTSQLGSEHNLTASQTGVANELLVSQEGVNNMVTISQQGTGANLGDRNIARVSQNGTGFTAGVTQSGMRNTSVINQH